MRYGTVEYNNVLGLHLERHHLATCPDARWTNRGAHSVCTNFAKVHTPQSGWIWWCGPLYSASTTVVSRCALSWDSCAVSSNICCSWDSGETNKKHVSDVNWKIYIFTSNINIYITQGTPTHALFFTTTHNYPPILPNTPSISPPLLLDYYHIITTLSSPPPYHHYHHLIALYTSHVHLHRLGSCCSICFGDCSRRRFNSPHSRCWFVCCAFATTTASRTTHLFAGTRGGEFDTARLSDVGASFARGAIGWRLESADIQAGAV